MVHCCDRTMNLSLLLLPGVDRRSCWSCLYTSTNAPHETQTGCVSDMQSIPFSFTAHTCSIQAIISVCCCVHLSVPCNAAMMHKHCSAIERWQPKLEGFVRLLSFFLPCKLRHCKGPCAVAVQIVSDSK